MLKPFCIILAACILLACEPVLAVDPADVPAACPADAVMAGPAELASMARWCGRAFGVPRLDDTVLAQMPDGRVVGGALRITLVRQDHAALRFNRSCLDTPLRMGDRTFAHGLGTHANSVIRVEVPAGAKTFKAAVGIDNNEDTGGTRGSVQVAVLAGGKELTRTATIKGGQPPVDVAVPLPADAKEIVLQTDTTDDGPTCDQTDWADARFIMADGQELFLDWHQDDDALESSAAPFSFVYDGTPSADLLSKETHGWTHAARVEPLADRTEFESSWADPATGLRVIVRGRVFKRFPAVDWVLHFENTGKQDSPILENVQALDATWRTGMPRREAVLHSIRGDDCSERSFLPFSQALLSGKTIRLAPSGGRSSNGTFPFFTLQYADRGLVAAIGWSGQWAAALDRSERTTRLTAGMEKTRLRLQPGEKIRTPRILLMSWQGERRAAQNRFRRLMLFHYLPRQGERPVAMPIFWQNYDRYNARPDWACEAGQIHAASVARQAGCDFLWLDAAWFPGNFPNGVGNWSAKPKEFPNGLKPVSDACHQLGLKFIVWFEPERVAPGSQIAREHPEFVFGGAKGGLFKLNDPAARAWLTDLLAKRIDEFGMDWYRNDFNLDPLPYWRAADTPDRQGMTEIRYVEGHYAMWDALRQRKAGLVIDNCASGGRRIDLESCMRSVPLWRSDTGCGPGKNEWNQSQAAGMNEYLPLHQTCGWTPAAYEFRGAAGAGVIAQFAFLEEGFSLPVAKTDIDEARANSKYSYGDFYPLTAVNTEMGHFMAWQLHRPDLNEGIVLAFRRGECENVGILVGLRAIDPAAEYQVEWIDEDRTRTTATVPGKTLAGEFPLKIARKPASLLVRYKKK